MLNFGSIFIETPKEPTKEEYLAAGGAKGEYERNKARHLELYDLSIDKKIDERFNKVYDKLYKAYGKPFDWIESKLPEIK